MPPPPARCATCCTASPEGRDVVVDLSETSFVDSTAIGVFVGAKRRFEARRCRLALSSPTASAARVLELTGMGRVVPIE